MYRSMRILPFLLLLGLVYGTAATAARAGYAHFLYDATDGKVLSAENADVLNHPASLTKMMTLYMTFEALRDGRLSWDQTIVMTPNAASKIPFKLGLKPGQPLTVREAVYGMAIRSANDAAAAMADHLGGSEDRFAVMMTEKAQALGMRQTVFRNASGLPDDAQVTTAHDLAVLAMALIRDYPKDYEIFSMRSFQFRGRKVPGHNNLMYRYPGMDGIKTGFVNASGFNIASAVTVNGRRYIGVMMGGKSARKRDDAMAALLDKYTAPLASTGTLVASADVPTAAAAAPAASKRLADGPKVLGFVAGRREMTVPMPGAPPAAIRPTDMAAVAGASSSQVASGKVGSGKLAVAAAPPVTAEHATKGGRVIDTPAAPAGRLASVRGKTDWSIQIVSGTSQKGASSALEKALPHLSRNFASAAASIESYSKGGREQFRGRFVGFTSQDAANDACAALQAKSITCLVVRSGA